jgi:hypothetical protein
MPSWLSSDVKSVICSKLESEFSRILKSLNGLKSALVSDIENIENLFNLPFKTLSDSMSDINNMINGLGSIVPDIYDLSSLNEILTFIERCTYLSTNPLLGDPYSMAKQLLDEYKNIATDYIQDYIDLIPSNILNSFDLGNKLLSYKDKLEKYKIFEKQDALNGILSCINAICKLDEQDNIIQSVQDYVTAQTAALSTIEGQLRITSDGQFDLDTVFDNAGINTEERLIMNNTMDSIEHVKETVNEAYENLKAASNGNTIPYPSTNIYTHFNTPTIYSSSTLFDQIDPSIMYSSDYLSTWSSLTLPSGTTTKQGTLDVKIEIDECSITETPDPNVNCFSTYTALVRIIIGFFECNVSGNGTTVTVTHVNHGLSTGNEIIVSDSTNDSMDGRHTITVIDTHTYTFSSTFVGTDTVDISSLFESKEETFEVGMPVCGTCGKFTKYGITSATDDDLYYIRKHMSEAIKEAIEGAMGLFTSSEVEDLIPNR